MASQTEKQLSYGTTAELYRAAIGPRGEEYYLRQFIKFDAQGKTSASWHWPAYWSTLNWLIYRRMWGWALAYVAALLGLALVVFGVGKLAFNYSDTTGLLLFLLFLTTAFVLPGLYANAWYYTYCSEKISAALRDTAEVKEACEVLAAQASTKRRWFGLASANVAVLALAAGLASFLFNPGQEGALLAQARLAKPAASEQLAGAVQPVAASAGVARPEPALALPLAPPAVQPAQAVADRPLLTSAAKIEEWVSKSAGDVSDTAAEPAAAKAAQAEPVQVAAANSTDKQDKPPASPAQPAVAKTKASPAATPAVAVAQAKPAHPEVQAPAAKAKRRWFVQAGAFAKEDNAQNVRARIEAAGLQTSAEPSDTPAGRLIRVRVGPFDSKAGAEKAALQIKALDLPAVLFREQAP